jgi:uncharacterized protein YoaH (UPF0181 family)
MNTQDNQPTHDERIAQLMRKGYSAAEAIGEVHLQDLAKILAKRPTQTYDEQYINVPTLKPRQ